jgi:hypothetical protein
MPINETGKVLKTDLRKRPLWTDNEARPSQ